MLLMVRGHQALVRTVLVGVSLLISVSLLIVGQVRDRGRMMAVTLVAIRRLLSLRLTQVGVGDRKVTRIRRRRRFIRQLLRLCHLSTLMWQVA